MHRLVPMLEKARAEPGRKAKVAAVAESLAAVARTNDDDELRAAARIVAGQGSALAGGLPLGVGWALVAAAACDALGSTPTTLRDRARRLGDLGDAVGEITAQAKDVSERPGLTILEVVALARGLATTSDREAKTTRLANAYRRARPLDAKYLTKVILGELRVGVASGVLEEAIARAFGRNAKAVREARTLTPDPGDLAILARDDELSRARLVFFSPIASMLASPIETVKAALDPAHTVWEDKLDGVRVQVHAEPGHVRLFARGGGDMTAVFPEVTHALSEVPRRVVLDGEILAVTFPRDCSPVPRPFQALQARLNRRDPDAGIIAAVPVALFAFDMLADGDPILELRWSVRHERLVALFAAHRFAPLAFAVEAHALDTERTLEAQVDEAFTAARARGQEGLVLKDTRAPYEAGRRGSAWRKVKRAGASLDVVITRAERGHGKRAQVLSDYTFAVWDGDTLVDIGKAYTGLTDKEIGALTAELEALTIEEVGSVRIVKPRIVLEVVFDGIQPSTRHASGFALRFPRIARIRDDKAPQDADTLATAKALFEASIATGHREAEPLAPHRPKTMPRGPVRKPLRGESSAGSSQLALFGDDTLRRTGRRPP